MDMLFYKKSLKEFGAKMRVLCVEDEDDIRSVMCELLRRYFNHVDEACNGQEALEYCYLETYDLIISDISMPIMNGVSFAQQVRKINEHQRIMIVSAHNEAEYLMDLINIGLDSFILKPIDTDKLIRSLYTISKAINDAYLMELYQTQLLDTNAELEKVNRILNNKIKFAMLSDNYSSEASKAHDKSPISCEVPTQTKGSTDLAGYHEQLLSEDIHEMKDLVDDIENYILLTLQTDTISTHYLSALSDRFRKFGSILCRYHFFTHLSSGLFELAKGIEDKEDFFISKQDFVAPFLENLIYVLNSYVEEVWIKSSENPNFFDASILNDIATFLAILGDTHTPSHTSDAEDLLEFF